MSLLERKKRKAEISIWEFLEPFAYKNEEKKRSLPFYTSLLSAETKANKPSLSSFLVFFCSLSSQERPSLLFPLSLTEPPLSYSSLPFRNQLDIVPFPFFFPQRSPPEA